MAGRANCSKATAAATGLPGKPSTGVSPSQPKASGLPGLMRTSQRSIAAFRLQHLLDQVVVADGDAAGGEQEVETLRLRQAAAQLLLAIAGRAQGDRLAAKAADHGGDHRPVAVADLSRHRAARPGSTISSPGGQHADTWPPVDGDVGAIERGQDADFGGAHARAGREHGLAGAHVLADRAHVLPGCDGAYGSPPYRPARAGAAAACPRRSPQSAPRHPPRLAPAHRS